MAKQVGIKALSSTVKKHSDKIKTLTEMHKPRPDRAAVKIGKHE